MAKACCAWPSKQLEKPYNWNHRRRSSKKWSLRLWRIAVEGVKWLENLPSLTTLVDAAEVIGVGDMKRDNVWDFQKKCWKKKS